MGPPIKKHDCPQMTFLTTRSAARILIMHLRHRHALPLTCPTVLLGECRPDTRIEPIFQRDYLGSSENSACDVSIRRPEFQSKTDERPYIPPGGCEDGKIRTAGFFNCRQVMKFARGQNKSGKNMSCYPCEGSLKYGVLRLFNIQQKNNFIKIKIHKVAQRSV